MASKKNSKQNSPKRSGSSKKSFETLVNNVLKESNAVEEGMRRYFSNMSGGLATSPQEIRLMKSMLKKFDTIILAKQKLKMPLTPFEFPPSHLPFMAKFHIMFMYFDSELAQIERKLGIFPPPCGFKRV